MPTPRDMPALIAEAEAISLDARTLFGDLTPVQLNWKPAPDRWSVAQCVDHLIRINAAYFPQFEAIEGGRHRRTWRDRVPLLSRAMGAMILRAVEPEATRKFKAAPHVSPAQSDLGGDIISRFIAHQRDVIGHMRRTASLDPARVIVTSAVAPAVFYSLLDAYRILVAHERRHMAQAERVTRESGFPRG